MTLTLINTSAERWLLIHSQLRDEFIRGIIETYDVPYQQTLTVYSAMRLFIIAGDAGHVTRH